MSQKGINSLGGEVFHIIMAAAMPPATSSKILLQALTDRSMVQVISSADHSVAFLLKTKH
jgi:hypothetical protein